MLCQSKKNLAIEFLSIIWMDLSASSSNLELRRRKKPVQHEIKPSENFMPGHMWFTEIYWCESS